MSVRESRKHVLLTWGSPGLVWAASPWVPIAATSCLARLQHWEQKRGGEDEAWPDHYSKCTCALWRTQFPHNSIMTKELISLKMTTRTNLSAPECMYDWVCVRVYVCVCECMCVCVWVRVCVSVYMHVCECVCECMCVHMCQSPMVVYILWVASV